ncbi:hypothetical protein BS78_10G170200, partial [Paspalum vaginatum]
PGRRGRPWRGGRDEATAGPRRHGRPWRAASPGRAASAGHGARPWPVRRGHGVQPSTALMEIEPVVPIGQTESAAVIGSSSQRSANPIADSQGDSMEWTLENLTLVCELFAEQVDKGNRPNTHLNAVGYAEVSNRFFQCTAIELSKLQLAWQKLMRRQTGTGWDHLRKTIDMDPEWWRKMKAEIPGCSKFKKGHIQNEELLVKMFKNITNNESDHWNPMIENPIVPDSQVHIDLDNDCVEVEHDNGANNLPDDVDEDDCLGQISEETKSSTTVVMQEHVKRIADSADAVATERLGEVTIKQVMDLVVACGAPIGSNEHYIATNLFVKKEQREMFLTLDTHESRINWLRRKYEDHYGA